MKRINHMRPKFKKKMQLWRPFDYMCMLMSDWLHAINLFIIQN